MGVEDDKTTAGEAALGPGERVPRGAMGEQPGDFIGPYKLMQVIGEGGFGIVWLAERREPMVQRVALKIIKPGMDSKAVIARFEQERQALAVMDHPNVAKVFDGGITPPHMGSRPYFVMEHVKGEPITEFCDRHRMTIRERLELFIPVCEAVQHAHMKGIIHRDLKPSNILVSTVDTSSMSDVGSGMSEGKQRGSTHPTSAIPHPTSLVKVIDFGVAKAISHTLTEKTIFTEAGQLIGTPEYMSPEQAEMGALDIDTRTDVYSLGVVLYELLTGLLPFDSKELRSKGYAEIQRIIREVEPPTPSRKLTGAGNVAVEIAAKRHAQREAVLSELRRELEWIPLRAMRKDRSHRYRGAGDLMDDVRRYLRCEPIEAAPPSLWYRTRKLIHRQQTRLTRVNASILILVAVAAVVLADSQRIRNSALHRAQFSSTLDQAERQLEEPGIMSGWFAQFWVESARINSGRYISPESVQGLRAEIITSRAKLAQGEKRDARTALERSLGALDALRPSTRPELNLVARCRVDALRALAKCAMIEGQTKEALELIERAMHVRAVSPLLRGRGSAIFVEHAQALSSVGRRDEATAELKRATEEVLQNGLSVVDFSGVQILINAARVYDKIEDHRASESVRSMALDALNHIAEKDWQSDEHTGG